ncbi:MAG: DUF2087 domain-containing protein [Anaerolineae bacterium]
MDPNPQVLDFVKAVSHADRLRIVGLLAQSPASIRQVADQLQMPFREAFNHLGMLEFAGVVHKDGDVFRLDAGALEKLSKQQLARPQAAPALPPGTDPADARVLSAFLKTPLPVRQLPAQASRLEVVLKHIASAFEPGVNYTEKEVNTIARRFHPDAATVRRYLVDAGLLQRESDGSRYWRPG